MLHQLSKDPLSETQMDLVMIILQQDDVEPDAKNNDGKTFLDLSPIHSKLLQRIETARDDWAQKVFSACARNTKIMDSWFRLGDDALLEALFNRLSQSMSSLSKMVCFLLLVKSFFNFS